jgi:hypothetical protein
MNGLNINTLVLTTLISIIGWLAVTMYSGTDDIRKGQQTLALKVNTLEAQVAHIVPVVLPAVLPIDEVRKMGDTALRVERYQSIYAQDFERRISRLEDRVLEGSPKSK